MIVAVINGLARSVRSGIHEVHVHHAEAPLFPHSQKLSVLIEEHKVEEVLGVVMSVARRPFKEIRARLRRSRDYKVCSALVEHPGFELDHGPLPRPRYTTFIQSAAVSLNVHNIHRGVEGKNGEVRKSFGDGHTGAFRGAKVVPIRAPGSKLTAVHVEALGEQMVAFLPHLRWGAHFHR